MKQYAGFPRSRWHVRSRSPQQVAAALRASGRKPAARACELAVSLAKVTVRPLIWGCHRFKLRPRQSAYLVAAGSPGWGVGHRCERDRYEGFACGEGVRYEVGVIKPTV
jgi:hypothetical protein